MTAQIQSLIETPDTFELVRDKIALILVEEIANQQTLATAGGKDPDDWKIDVYTERSNAWEKWLNNTTQDIAPLCNIWYDNSNFDQSTGNVISRQKDTAIYNLDILAIGNSEDVPAGGHTAGDKDAAFAVQAAARLIRKIIMSGHYVYLDMQGQVWKRWLLSRTAFQPQFQGQQIQHVQGIRLPLQVEFNEFSPEYSGKILEEIGITIKRDLDGKILLQADYDYTA